MTSKRAAGRDEVDRAPGWIVVLAWATPACVLPSSLWRFYAITRLPDGCPDSFGMDVYVVGLSVVSLAAASLTVGLVSSWGRRVPAWVPFLGGRPVDPRGVVVAATVGIAILAALYAYTFLNPLFDWREPNDDMPGCPPPEKTDEAWLAYAAYTPLLAWLPLLVTVTVDFYRRTVRSR